MSLARYIKKFKEYGVRHSLEIIWRFRIDWLIQDVIVLFVKNKELENSIIIESHNDFDCNGGAFYQYLIDNGYNNKYKIVWLLKHPKCVPDHLPRNVECFPLYSPSIKKDIRITTAKFLLSDNVIVRKNRKEQISVYCTHGAFCLKNVKGVAQFSGDVDYFLSPSLEVEEIVANQLNIEYPNPMFVHLGYPSEDIFYRKKTPIKIGGKNITKYILWMPTFRKGGGYNRNDSLIETKFGIPLIQSEEELISLNALLGENGYYLVIKIHPMQDLTSISQLHSYSNIIVLTGIDIKKENIDNYQLMANADAMISDYSSSVFSFLHNNKPIAIVLSDLKEYKNGLCVDNPDDFIPGAKIISNDDFLEFVNDVFYGKDIYSNKRQQVFDKVYKHHDGNSCKRLADFLKL